MKLIYTKVKGKRVSSGPEGERATAGPGGTGITDRSSQPSRPSAKPSTNSICWDLSEQVLSTLATAAQFAPVPYLDNVSALALSIFKGVQGAKENQEALGELSKTAIQLALLVSNTYEELHPSNTGSDTPQVQSSFSSDPTLNTHVEQLVKALQDIDHWIKGVQSRKFVRRLIAYKSDLRVIQNFRVQLRDSMDKFQLQSSITLRSSLSRIASQQDKIEKDAADQHILLCEIHEGLHIRQRPMPNLPASLLRSPVSSSATNIDLGNPNASDIATTAPNSISLATILESSSIQESVSVDNSAGNHTADSSIANSIRENIKNISNGQNINFGKWTGVGLRRGGDTEDRLAYGLCLWRF
ncbi:hypothetical protein F5880DRAFT_1612357 [Lentinula raphanica]|nr:hypothetical protein F5880DRAFT_1612357 [Lentinula raphanica]